MNLDHARSRMLAIVLQGVNVHHGGWHGILPLLNDFDREEAMDLIIHAFGSAHPYVKMTEKYYDRVESE